MIYVPSLTGRAAGRDVTGVMSQGSKSNSDLSLQGFIAMSHRGQTRGTRRPRVLLLLRLVQLQRAPGHGRR